MDLSYLDSLNDAQRAAVENVGGPTMVIAGAGSGKTRVLTLRIAYLIQKGIDPFNILALTFTNKAAKEMKERISSIVGDEARNIWMGTFHSVFAKILRFEADKIGYPRNFTIYDTQDSRSLIKTLLKEMHLDDKAYKPASVLGRISSAKNNLITPKAYAQNPEVMKEDKIAGRGELWRIYESYQDRLKRSGAMDFDDLLFNTNILFRDYPDVLRLYQHKFRYILVDEYQDTNFSQYLIVKKLAAVNENLCVVGDDAQSIYAFRGANIQNILNFRTDYPDFKMFKLEQNYRSTQNIVKAANSVIGNNKDQIEKKVWTANGDGELIKVLKCYSDNEEGKRVAETVFEKHQQEQISLNDFAVLYRTNAQSRAMEEALRKLNIAYKIYGGTSFYQRKEIKDILSYFRLTINPKDEEAFKRIINFPARGIGQTTMDKIILAAAENNISLWDVAEQPLHYGVKINGPTATRISDFTTMILSFQSMIEKVDAYEVANHIAKHSGIIKELHKDKSPEGVSRYENIEELLAGIKEFSESGEEDEIKLLPSFLEDVALLTDADKEEDEDIEKVSLMTIHASKGLEFPYVFIVGMEENLFPSQLSLNNREELEEERRLFYVALTRAEKKAFLSYAEQRYKWGNLTFCEPSRFLNEIAEDFIDLPEEKTFTTNARSGNAKSLSGSGGLASQLQKRNMRPVSKTSGLTNMDPNYGDDLSDLAENFIVEHQKFGIGQVLKVFDGKAKIAFKDAGTKDLLLKFAKLKIKQR